MMPKFAATTYQTESVALILAKNHRTLAKSHSKEMRTHVAIPANE